MFHSYPKNKTQLLKNPNAQKTTFYLDTLQCIKNQTSTATKPFPKISELAMNPQ